MAHRVYQSGRPADRWEVGMLQERRLLPDVEDPSWAEFAAAHNEYYGCSATSPIRLHVDEDGQAYTIPKEA